MGDDNRTVLDTTRADRAVWLMKCPPVVSRSWSSSAAASDPALAAPVVAKVVLTLDLLQPDQPPTFKMELAKNEPGNTPKSYSLNMHKDFVPMCVFTESASGKLSLEGKVDHKFDMEPHSENFAQYGKLCRERTTKSMIKNRQVQVYTDDHGGNMNPMPGMLGLMSSSVSKEKKKMTPTKPSDLKRTRRDRQELENIIFKLFERQQNWALKQLVIETNQPEAQEIKPVTHPTRARNGFHHSLLSPAAYCQQSILETSSHSFLSFSKTMLFLSIHAFDEITSGIFPQIHFTFREPLSFSSSS